MRLYFSTDTSPLSPTVAADWEVTDVEVVKTLTTTPDGSFAASHSAANSEGGNTDGKDICLWRATYGPLSSDEAAVIAAGGAAVRAQVRARARFGIGISEAAQDMITQLGVRVTQGGTNTIRGTALALHALGSSAGSSKWPAASTRVNKQAPPAASATHVLSAVAGTAAGDYLVVELGSRNFTDSGEVSGSAIALTNSAAGDLPEDDTTTSALNSWIEIIAPETPVNYRCDPPQPTVRPGEQADLPRGGRGISTSISRSDHVHEHGLLSADGTHMHDADHIAGLDDPPSIEGFVRTTAGGQHEVAIVSSPGSALTLDLEDANVFDVTLDDDCAIDFAGLTAGVECRWRVHGHWAGFTPSWPASVVWPDGIEPTWSTDPDEFDVVEFATLDGGTVIAGDAGGSASADASALDDLTDVTITSATEDDDLRFDGSTWINDPRKWEAVTAGEDVFVWDGDDLVHDWST